MEAENSTFIKRDAKLWSEHWPPKTWLVALHKRLSLIYAQRFTAPFQGGTTIDEWCEVWGQGLVGVNAEQMRYGLDLMQKRHTDWPPALPEFRECCTALPKMAPAALPPPPKAGTDCQAECMAIIRDMLAHPKPAGNWWAHEVAEKVARREHVTLAGEELARKALRFTLPKWQAEIDGYRNV